MALDFDKYNEAVRDWDATSNRDIKARGNAHDIIHRSGSPSPSASLSKFKSRLTTRGEVIVKISKTFPRQLIWTHKGAGKGMGGMKGSRWIDKYGNSKSTNPKSYGKMATGTRKAKEFINESLEGPQGVDELATIAAEHLGDALVGSLFIK